MKKLRKLWKLVLLLAAIIGLLSYANHLEVKHILVACIPAIVLYFVFTTIFDDSDSEYLIMQDIHLLKKD